MNICWLVYFKKYAVLVKCLWEKNICWVVIIVSHDLPVRECKIFVRWKIFVRFKKYLVNARGWGQNGRFAAWTYLSELTNGANLTNYGRNGFGVKKIWLSGLDVQPNFLVACVSNTSFLMACLSKSLENTGTEDLHITRRSKFKYQDICLLTEALTAHSITSLYEQSQ
jgi:hypothetical protein